MRACQAAPIYFISTLIKRKLIATSLIMLQAAFDDMNGKKTPQKVRCKGSEAMGGGPGCSRDGAVLENKQALPLNLFHETIKDVTNQ